MLQLPALVQLVDSFQPIRPFTAVAVLLSGIGTVANARNHRRLVNALAGAVLALALLGIAGAQLGIGLPLEGWLEERARGMGLSWHGGIPLLVALSLGLHAVALLRINRLSVSEGELLAVYALGILLIASSGIFAIVHVSNLAFPAMARFGAGDAIQTLVSLALLGVTLILSVSRLHAIPTSPPRWVPAFTGLSMGALVLVLWLVLRAQGGSEASSLPDVVLVLGVALAALFALVLQLLRTSWTQARLVESARFQSLLDNATDGIWEFDFTTNAGRRSRSQLRHLGYDPDQVNQDPDGWRNLIHVDDRDRVLSIVERNRTSVDLVEDEISYRVRAADDSYHTIVDRGRVVERTPDQRTKLMLGISADVTERQRADAAREASELRFRAMFDAAQQFQVLLDLDGVCLEVNATALAMAHVGPEAVIGVPMVDGPWWRGSPGARGQLASRFADAAAGYAGRFEVETSPLDDRVLLLDLCFTPLRGEDGAVMQVLAEGRDITEKRRVEDALREIGSLTTMGRLAARVAHEINNPLAGIQNSFLLLADAIPEDHPHRRFVGAIEREIQRIAMVTRQLYETYRPDQDSNQHSSVVLAVSDAVTFLGQVNRGRGVRIVTDVTRAPPSIPVPDALLRQTLYNLVQNAVEASPPNGVVTVTAALDGKDCVLVVSDQGLGVAANLRDRIWDPFFSTKDAKVKTSGMGLGLALVRQSVEAVGGAIFLRDTLDGGATFEVRLPMTSVTRTAADRMSAGVA
jgi:PAS domain S-box-containing protein